MKPGAGWPIGIATVLVATVVGNLVVMRVAGNDPAFAVEPDYYRKAVEYDATMAQERANAALGWTATSAFAPLTDGRDTPLRVTLADASGAAVSDATVRVVAMFNARSGDRLDAVLVPEGDGRYVTTLPVAWAGQWEVRIDATRGADRFTASQRVEVSRQASAPAAAPDVGTDTGTGGA